MRRDMNEPPTPVLVGPILEAGQFAQAIVVAIRAQNRDVVVTDRGGYLRVGVPDVCVVTRDAIEAAIGQPFHLPTDLERVMPAFAGRLTIDDERAKWSVGD